MPFRHACLVAEMAGYAHDLGKASQRFQEKLLSNATGHGEASRQKDVIRHEWLSSWLLSNMLSPGEGPVDSESLNQAWREMKSKEGAPDGPSNGRHLPVPGHMTRATDAVLWGVCTHHGAMGGELSHQNGLSGSEHIRTNPVDLSSRRKHLILHQPRFADGSSKDAARWADLLEKLERVRKRLQDVDRPPEYWEGVMLVARAALIFADHKVSSLTFDEKVDGVREDGILFANTKAAPRPAEPPKSLRPLKRSKAPSLPLRLLDQPLSWHLREVGERAAANVRMFTGDGLPTVDPDLVRGVLASRAPEGSRFVWQDKAVDAVSEQPGGKLVFNVASTGAGKTRANLKMAFAMRQDGVRLAVAFNLRSLTTQTFAAFGKHLKAIDAAAAFERDFACLLGDRGAVEMDFSQEDEDDVNFEEDLDLVSKHPAPDWLTHIAGCAQQDDKVARLIASPVLVSTMDWIVACGEPGQQDRHAKALIRVANSDLILDEVDSYDLKATVAVMRVVQTAATFGRNVIVSSATLSPALANGLIIAYTAGRKTYDAMWGQQPWSMIMTSDQFDPKVLNKPSEEQADVFYRDTMKAMSQGLGLGNITKRYRLAPVRARSDFCPVIAEQAARLHEVLAAVPPGLPCRLSIGLVRVANVSTCMEVSEALRQDGRFVVSAYHARDILERRAWKEERLDRILARSDDAWIDALVDAAPWIKTSTGDVRLIVVATPVEEVGRDHDFDWAIIEPSSMHSILQTAGRVNRHRCTALQPGEYNVVLLTRNKKDLENGMGKACFERPGLEFMDQHGAIMTHPSHDLDGLMQSSQAWNSDGHKDQAEALDAALIFDEGGRQTKFAQYDEAAMADTISHVLPVFRRASGYAMHFMLRDYPKKFPLRDGSVLVHYKIDLDLQAFYSFPTLNGMGQAKWGKTPDRVWLCPDPQTLRHAHFSVKSSPPESGQGARQPQDRVDVLWNGLVF